MKKIITIFMVVTIIGVMSYVGGSAIPPRCYSINNSVLKYSEMNQEEIWKDVVGFEGLYKVSTNGRMKSLIRKSEKILKGCISQYGYMRFFLHKNGEMKTVLSHRVVAMSFINNPSNKPYVNHKNGTKTDNRVSNLEWCTASENSLHSYRIGLSTPNKTQLGKYGKLHHGSKPVVQISLTGHNIKQYESICIARKETGINHISGACNGRHKTAGGYKWKYIN